MKFAIFDKYLIEIKNSQKFKFVPLNNLMFNYNQQNLMTWKLTNKNRRRLRTWMSGDT